MDFTFENKQLPAKGKLLISDPFISDGYFDRSVVLLCEHNDEGTFGFVLNNFVDIPFHEISDKFPVFDTKVSIGGPVSKENLFFLHKLGSTLPGSVAITDKIFAGGDFSILVDLIQRNEIRKTDLRFFIGYSGWTEGQLNEEIEANTWIVSDKFDDDFIMNVEENHLWQKLMKTMGKKFSRMTDFPQNPNWN